MERLMDALGRLYPDSSRTSLKSWIEEGRIYVGGKRARRPDQEVKGEIELKKKEKPTTHGLKIYHSDQDLVVIEKPSGLLSVKAASEREKSAHSLLKEAFYPKKVYVIHRLDQETSGVMLFGLSERSYGPLKEQFKLHTVERRYTALVEGYLEGWGTWQAQIEEDLYYRVHVVEEGGEEAITHYKALDHSPDYTLLECQLETGKKNQIRVQAAFAGHPVAGDEKYGAESNPIGRLALHATHLAFDHPWSGKPLRFYSPPPPLFVKPFKKKRKRS